MANMKTEVYTEADFTVQNINHMWYHKCDPTAGQLSTFWPLWQDNVTGLWVGWIEDDVLLDQFPAIPI